MSQYELAQLNIGIMKEPLDTPRMADFVGNLDRINALAETSPGFVWRLQTDEGNATSLRPLDEDTIVNMSVWADVESLRAYVYKTAHAEIMRRRKEWFDSMSEAYIVLWWVRAGHRPTVDEALAKLDLLRQHGPTAEAFTFRDAFPPPADLSGFERIPIRQPDRSTGKHTREDGMNKVNLAEKLSQFTEHWSPRIVGELNGQHVKLVKLKGEFVWHNHENEDELFLVVKGSLLMRLRDGDVTINEGEFLIVPRGVDHKPVAQDEVHVLLFEPAGTLNTGNVENERTVANPARV